MQKVFTAPLLVLLTATFFYMSSLMMIGPIAAGFCVSLGGGGLHMGVVSGLCYYTSLVCRPFVGGIIDLGRWNRIALAGLLCMAAGGGICAAAPNIWALMLGRAFTGAGFAVSSGTLATWVAASLPKGRVGQGMGIYGVVQAVAQALAPAAGLEIAETFGYRAACAAAGVLALLGCALILPLRPDCPGAQTGAVGRRRFFLREAAPVSLIIFLFCIPYIGTSTFLSTVASERGLAFHAGSFFTVYAVFLLVVRLLLSRVLDCASFRKMVLCCVPFGTASMLCLQWMQGRTLMILAALLLTGAYGMMQPVCQSASIKMAGESRRGVANCTYYMGLDAGLAFGATLSGGIYQLAGQENLYLVLALTPILAVPALGLMDKRDRSSSDCA